MEASKSNSLSSDGEITKKLLSKHHQRFVDEFIQEILFLSLGQYTFDVDTVCKKGENYVGVLYRVTANSNGKNFRAILKIPPINEALRRISFAGPFFAREILFYEIVYPIFENFQNEKQSDEMFNNVPKCYRILSNKPDEGIFMEDLAAGGFETFDRFEILSGDHVKVVMRTLGKFHAISFAIKDQKPEMMKPFMNLKDVLYQRLTDISLSTSTRGKLVNRALNVALESNNEVLIEKVKKLLSNDFCELLECCVDGAYAEPYAVICHGDCYNNNIMFKHDKEGNPVDVRLIDWQVMRYASPVCDLAYYIFVCTSKELRQKHYKDFLNVYYESLAEFIVKLGLDPMKTFPREAFEDQLKKFGKFGILMAILALPFVTIKPENLPNMEKVTEKIVKAKEKGENLEDQNLSCFVQGSSAAGGYNQRMLSVFEDMCDLEYI